MAKLEPEVDVIAVEVYRRGLAQLLSAIERENVTNIRLIRGDAVDVLESLIAPASLSGVRVFFPDPWPKARHHKRRLLQPATVALIADRLHVGGVLHAATDHPGYAEQIAEVGDAEPRLTRADPLGELPISVVRPTTKYEDKARHAGSAVTELVWERREP
jgi:tRNA (guanine-N7-)-methyltransferase